MIRHLFVALCCLSALPAHADMSAVEDLREGSMKKLAFGEPKTVDTLGFTELDGTERSLEEYRGKIILLNFWATWCAPCRKEMPALDELQAELGGEDFTVLPIATGRNTETGLRKFFEEEGIANLPILTDPKQELARAFAVLGLPITVILDRDGNEIARLMGDAEWNSDSAKAIIGALVVGEDQPEP